ncbi:hypothetical protein QUA00_07855 [Microcoleus sp. T2B6]|uniref:hypothetical protein n=1 Tax=unclassified Microcoleus TaxID=2642155 RepID=UPI002FD2AA4F
MKLHIKLVLAGWTFVATGCNLPTCRALALLLSLLLLVVYEGLAILDLCCQTNFCKKVGN